MPVVLALATGGYLYFGGGGLRSGWHRRRRKAHESDRSSAAGGTPGPGRAPWLPVGLFAAPAALALAASVGLYTVPFAAAGAVELVSTSELYVWFVPATVLASFGAVLAGKALLRHAELAPAPHAPAPIRLLPADSEFVALLGLVLAGFLATEGLILLAAPPLAFGPLLLMAALYRQADLAPVTVPPTPFRLLPDYTGRITALVVLAAVMSTLLALHLAYPEVTVPEERAVRGEAEIVGQDCTPQQGSACQGYLVVLFEYDGMVYRDRVETELLGMDALVETGSAEIEWDAADPTEVRLAR
ncbi:hypothetical protein H4W79_004316 [Nocardiopsis terrae]|uniref:Uncharacterized protein n=1 Tax=Nocardiopsis terrae TaxID=372655 RepID=A0ABR9HM54_9ACTN|nr:hypothetical protein [Nocardiopsis terrae]MBE1460102.1 hypothetical protein [Nocardiopsis terrae]